MGVVFSTGRDYGRRLLYGSNDASTNTSRLSRRYEPLAIDHPRLSGAEWTGVGGDDGLPVISGGIDVPASRFAPWRGEVLSASLAGLNATDLGAMISGNEVADCQHDKVGVSFNGAPLTLARWPNIDSSSRPDGWQWYPQPSRDLPSRRNPTSAASTEYPRLGRGAAATRLRLHGTSTSRPRCRRDPPPRTTAAASARAADAARPRRAPRRTHAWVDPDAPTRAGFRSMSEISDPDGDAARMLSWVNETDAWIHGYFEWDWGDVYAKITSIRPVEDYVELSYDGAPNTKPHVPLRGYSEDGSRRRRGCEVNIPLRGYSEDKSRRRHGCDVDIPLRGCSEDESRRRRGCDVDIPWSRVAAATRTFRGDEPRTAGMRVGCPLIFCANWTRPANTT